MRSCYRRVRTLQIKNKVIWVKALVTLFVIIQFYWQDFTILFHEAIYNDITTHIIAIPFILAIIIYRLRNRILTSINFKLKREENITIIEKIIGVSLCLSAYMIKLYGSYTFQPLEYHVLSLPLFISGITLILFSFQTLRELIFPILFTLFLVPPPIVLTQQAGAILSVYSSEIAYSILKAFSPLK